MTSEEQHYAYLVSLAVPAFVTQSLILLSFSRFVSLSSGSFWPDYTD